MAGILLDMDLFTVLCLLVILLLSIAVGVKLLKRRNNYNSPPCISGWLPWLGCAVDFGKAPLTFLDEARRKCGDVFTIHAAGKRMTFLSDPDDISVFMQSDALDFQKAVQPFTSKAAGLPAASFASSHRGLHDMVKGKLSSGKLSHLGNTTLKLFEEKLHLYASKYSGGGSAPSAAQEEGVRRSIGDRPMSLQTLVQSVMFHAGMQSLFGQQCIADAKDIDQFRQTFEKFDLDFEYGAELPSIFLPKWASCKAWLLELMKGVVDRLEVPTDSSRKNTLLEDLVLNVDKGCAHNYALLLLWATQANALPAVFWTLAFLHQKEHKHLLERARVEADSVLANRGEDGFVAYDGFAEEDLKNLQFILWCVLEGVRLRSPGMITRLAVKPLKVKDYIIPAGDYVMISPYWLHRNETRFPDSGSFSPERWQSAEIAKNNFLPGFVGFGGGRYQCPGRWFALMEMQLMVAVVIHYYDMELLHDVPTPNPLHLVGIQQPVGECDVRLRRRH